jgi:hypothetical protein
MTCEGEMRGWVQGCLALITVIGAQLVQEEGGAGERVRSGEMVRNGAITEEGTPNVWVPLVGDEQSSILHFVVLGEVDPWSQSQGDGSGKKMGYRPMLKGRVLWLASFPKTRGVPLS